jgi:hypothetical protein
VAGDISPDNKWVTSILPTDSSKVLLLPTGIGETKAITAPNFQYQSANFANNGRRLVVLARESGRPLRFWVMDIAGSSPRAVTPEGLDGLFVTINHSDFVCSRDSQGTVRLYPIDGGEPAIVKGLSGSDRVVGGASGSDVLYVTTDSSAMPMQIFKVSIATGLRQRLLSLSAKDPAGIRGLYPPIFSPDEKKYVCTQVRQFSVLYIATGLK